MLIDISNAAFWTLPSQWSLPLLYHLHYSPLLPLPLLLMQLGAAVDAGVGLLYHQTQPPLVPPVPALSLLPTIPTSYVTLGVTVISNNSCSSDSNENDSNNNDNINSNTTTTTAEKTDHWHCKWQKGVSSLLESTKEGY